MAGDVTGIREQAADQVLVYEARSDDARLLASVVREFGLRPVNAEDARTALELAAGGRLRMAVVDVGLPRITLDPSLRVVCTGEPRTGAAITVMRYHPLCFVAKPLLRSVVSAAIARATGSRVLPNTMPSRLVGLCTELQELHARVAALVLDESFQETLGESMKTYCRELCPLGMTVDRIAESALERYEVLHVLAARGTVYCDRQASCCLLQFAAWIAQQHPDLERLAPAHVLARAAIGGESVPEMVEATAGACAGALVAVQDASYEYCAQACPLHRKGMAHDKGDKIIPVPGPRKAGDLVTCAHRECQMDAFMRVYRME